METTEIPPIYSRHPATGPLSTQSPVREGRPDGGTRSSVQGVGLRVAAESAAGTPPGRWWPVTQRFVPAPVPPLRPSRLLREDPRFRLRPSLRGGPEPEEEEGDEDNERLGGGGREGGRGGRPTRWPLLQEQPQQQQVGGRRRRWRWRRQPWPGGLGQSQSQRWQRRRRRLPRRWRRPRGLGAERSCCSDQRGYISHYVLTVSTEDI
ncbi:uncharacterized protein LOC144580258 isoform X2 [Callithrix jacchus]